MSDRTAVATIAFGMFRIAGVLDRLGVYDVADRMDRAAQKQMVLPLVMDPKARYTDRARDLIPHDQVPEWVDDDQGLYHVTTNYPSVLDRGLMSRQQLGNAGIQGQGLGGEIPYESPGMVATTYSPGRAQDIESQLQELAGWLRGSVPTKNLIQRIYDAGSDDFDDWEEGGSWEKFSRGLANIASQYGVKARSLRGRLAEGDETAVAELGDMIDAAGLDPQDRYTMIQDMEKWLYEVRDEEYEGVDDKPPDPTAGLAAPFESIKDMDPDAIRTIQLRARRGAPIEHWPQEEQVNLYPWDLQLDTPDLLPHEQRAIQETMMPPRRPEGEMSGRGIV